MNVWCLHCNKFSDTVFQIIPLTDVLHVLKKSTAVHRSKIVLVGEVDLYLQSGKVPP